MSVERDLLKRVSETFKQPCIATTGFNVLLDDINELLSQPEAIETGLTPNIIDCSQGYHDGRNALRDHFAGLAMQGMIAADPDICIMDGELALAHRAYQQADAMLLERDKCKNGLGEGL